MTDTPACPICTMTDILVSSGKHECVTCGHEWPREPGFEDDDAGEAAAVVVEVVAVVALFLLIHHDGVQDAVAAAHADVALVGVTRARTGKVCTD